MCCWKIIYFVSGNQDDWATWLDMAEFSYNNTPSSSTKFSPFFSLQGYHPRYNLLMASSRLPSADLFITHLQEGQTQLQDNLMKAKAAQSRFYNKDKRIDVSYNPGDLVWLSRRRIKTRRQNSKRDVRRIGPFRVQRMIGKNAAELELTKGFACLHPVFDVSLLMQFLAQEIDNLDDVPPPKDDFIKSCVDRASISYVSDYCSTSPGIHEYLIREADLSGLNDEWRLLTTLSPNLDQFLCKFHKNTPSQRCGPDIGVWQQRALMQV